jgi:hypothetical protein
MAEAGGASSAGHGMARCLRCVCGPAVHTTHKPTTPRGDSEYAVTCRPILVTDLEAAPPRLPGPVGPADRTALGREPD